MPHSDPKNVAGHWAPSHAVSVTIEGGPELLDDGQEEVFAYSAVERGVVEDPKALSPEDLARAPVSPGRLTDR